MRKKEKNDNKFGAPGAPHLGRQLMPPSSAIKKKNRPKFRPPPAPLSGGAIIIQLFHIINFIKYFSLIITKQETSLASLEQ